MKSRQPEKPIATPSVAAPNPAPQGNRRVENYVGIPLERRLLSKLERFVAAFPDAISEEDLFAMLLDLGVDQAAALPFAQLKRIVPNRRAAVARVSVLPSRRSR
jgi:hypothetical protein